MTQRLPIHAIDAADAVDGDVVTASGGVAVWSAGGGSTIFLPLSTTVGGDPQLVFQPNGELILVEVPSP